MADYPDPDNFLRGSSIPDFLHSHGWHDPFYEDLIDRAAETRNRPERMAMYRRADRYLTSEMALVKPLTYGLAVRAFLKQPWVQDMGFSSLGFLGARFITMGPRENTR